MTTFKNFVRAAGATALLAMSVAPAHAVTLSQGGSTTLAWAYNNVDGATINVTAKFTLTTLNAGSAIFAVEVKNNSTGPGQNVLVSFGIKDVTPDITSAQVTNNADAVTWLASLNDDLTGNFKNLELCLYASNGCGGGAISNGLGVGLTDTFTLALTGAFVQGGTVSFAAPFGSKFQGVGVNGNSWELGGCVQGEAGCVPADCRPGTCDVVPEPGTLALVGLGLLGLGLSRRKQNA